MANDDSDQKLHHAIMVAFPFQGHITPFVHLALKLASNGFTVTFVHNEHIHHQIISQYQTHNSDESADLFASARNSGLDIRYRTINDSLPLEFDRSHHGVQYWERLRSDFPACVDELIGDLVGSDPSAKYFLVADTFYIWQEEIAKKYGLVNVSFWTQSALAFTLYYHIDLLKKNGHLGSAIGNLKDPINYIPGVTSIDQKDLISYLQDTDQSSISHQIVYEAFDRVRTADFIICNCVQELEDDVISAIQPKLPIFPIGPILSIGFSTIPVPVAAKLRPEIDCTSWLNKKANGSVLYISFGSLTQVAQSDILGILHGLLLSRVDFVWVLRHNLIESSSGCDLLPPCLEDAVQEGRGLIVQWCNQIEVISHPAIGGFLTHCGWNSILESIWCGVPLICYPIFTDQLTNRKLVVCDWKIGINLCDKMLISREEVAEKIRYLMSSILSKNQRKMIKEIKNALENALSNEGSSVRSFSKFIDELRNEVQMR